MLKFSSLFQKQLPPEQILESNKQNSPSLEENKHDLWTSLADGELLIDMYEQPDSLVIRSLVAGARPEDIEISVHNDMLTIQGRREEVEELYDNQFIHRECYWGGFSRTIILPAHVDSNGIKAYFKNGVMTIILPKLDKHAAINPEEDVEDEALLEDEE